MKKRFMLTTTLMLVFTLLALSTATYAWFTMSNDATVKDFTISATSSSGGLEISSDGTAFVTGELNWSNPSLSALDVTSPNGIDLYKGTAFNNAGIPTTVVAATEDVDYYQFDLYFRTNAAGKLVLSASSDVTPATTNDNMSSYGDFSRDYIAAATRVSFAVSGTQNAATNAKGTEWSDNSSPSVAFTLEPQRLVNLREDATTAGLWTLQTSGSFEATKPLDSSATEVTYATVATGVDHEICQFPAPAAAGNIMIVRVTVRIWIEGQDKEAKSPLALGNFITSLDFKYVPLP